MKHPGAELAQPLGRASRRRPAKLLLDTADQVNQYRLPFTRHTKDSDGQRYKPAVIEGHPAKPDGAIVRCSASAFQTLQKAVDPRRTQQSGRLRTGKSVSVGFRGAKGDTCFRADPNGPLESRPFRLACSAFPIPAVLVRPALAFPALSLPYFGSVVRISMSPPRLGWVSSPSSQWLSTRQVPTVRRQSSSKRESPSVRKPGDGASGSTSAQRVPMRASPRLPTRLHWQWASDRVRSDELRAPRPGRGRNRPAAQTTGARMS